MRLCSRFALALLLLLTFSCKHSGPVSSGEVMYVSAPQANLRDHVSTVYNRIGSVNNGERVEVLERQKRFVRVRTSQKVEGWIELRSLVPAEVFEQFQKNAKENTATPVEGHGVTRAELNMHVSPGRETDTLYQLAEGSKVEMLKRATTGRATPEEIAAKKAAALARETGEAPKAAPKRKPAAPPAAAPQAAPAGKDAAPAKGAQNAAPAQTATTTPGSNPAGGANAAAGANAAGTPPVEDKPKPMDDWWLVRDAQGRVGWVLARMVDLDIPLDVLQYAEGQRIQAAFVLNTVHDDDKGDVAQYLVLLNENKDGIPYDFNQVRVFTWNLKRHRYETGFRDHTVIGYFPAKVGVEDFPGEGTMPVFTIRRQNEDGTIGERKYRVIGNIVRPVLAPGEQPPKAAKAQDKDKDKKDAKKPESKGKAAAKGKAKTKTAAKHKKH